MRRTRIHAIFQSPPRHTFPSVLKSTVKRIKVLIADDHRMVVDGLIALLGEAPEIEIIGTASNGAEAIELAEAHPEANVMIMDISMPVMDGIQAIKSLSRSRPNLQLLALTQNADKGSITRALKAGVSGYLLKSAQKSEFLEAVRTVAEGGTYFNDQMKDALISSMSGTTATSPAPDSTTAATTLTEREREILRLIALEHTTNEIAERLYISPYTVETHRKNLIQKLGVRNSAGLVKAAVRLGLAE